jgi:hypothetical protein
MIIEYPLRWPEGWPRSNSHEWGGRFRQGSGLDKTMLTLDKAQAKLRAELLRLGARDAVLSIATARERDVGVALYFTMNGRQMAMASDRFDTRAANTRSIGLAIEAMRQLERHGGGAMVERAFAGFAALPPPPTCWQVLGLAPGASEAAIRAAFKDRASQSGAGGNVDMGQLVKARDEALGKAAA